MTHAASAWLLSPGLPVRAAPRLLTASLELRRSSTSSTGNPVHCSSRRANCLARAHMSLSESSMFSGQTHQQSLRPPFAYQSQQRIALNLAIACCERGKGRCARGEMLAGSHTDPLQTVIECDDQALRNRRAHSGFGLCGNGSIRRGLRQRAAGSRCPVRLRRRSTDALPEFRTQLGLWLLQ